MPKQYTAMRDKFARDMPLADAKTKAAKIYNARNPGNPVTGSSDSEPDEDDAATEAQPFGGKKAAPFGGKKAPPFGKGKKRRMPPPVRKGGPPYE